MAPTPEREEALFGAAARLPAGERAAFLQRACAGDDSLQQRLEARLRGAVEASTTTEAATETITRVPNRGDPGATRRLLELEKPGDLIGRYKLLEQIGEGGFGAVYVAEQREPVKRRVALKVLKLGMDTEGFIARFEAERQALALMDHPNIAKVFDAGATEKGRPYFVMELVRGISITKYCDEHSLTAAERLELFIKVCQAIQHAHQKGVIHRDIKPSNILVTVNDGVPVPKVIDFGIAKATQGVLTDKTLYTQFEAFLGTPAYTSPEQAEMTSVDVDTRSDIYSLGVVLYELLTGKTPFDGRELIEAGLDAMRRTLREKDPLRPSTRVRSLRGEELSTTAKRRNLDPPKLISLLSGDLDWIVMKALEKDRKRRYETANGLAMDVQRHLRNEPVLARPPSTAYVLQKLLRRHRVAFATASLVAASLVAGIVASSWYAVQMARAEQEAVTESQKARQAEQAARAEQTRADEEAKRASRLLYIAHMNLAKSAWDESGVRRVLELLERHRPLPDRPDLRGFEWFYLERLCHGDLRTMSPHTRQVMGVAFSPDGKRVASVSQDETVKISDAGTGEVLLTLTGHTAVVHAVAFSTDGRRLVTGGNDRTVKIWDAERGKELLTLTGHEGNVLSVAFSADGSRVASAGTDQTVKVWSAVSGREQATLQGHTNSVTGVAFAPDGRLASASLDRTVKVWDAANGRELLTLSGHAREVSGVAFSRDGRWLAASGYDQTVRIWDAASGQPKHTLKGHAGRVHGVAFSPDGRRLATASEDHTVKVWNAVAGVEFLTLKGHTRPVRGVAFSPDSNRIVSGADDRAVKVWDATEDREALTLRGHARIAVHAAFSPDGLCVASAANDRTVRLWDAGTGRELLAFEGHAEQITGVAFSPDGRRIYSSSLDGAVKVWASTNGGELLSFKGQGRVHSLALNADGTRLASGGNRVVKVWDTANGATTLTLPGHDQIITGVAFSPDGRTLATASHDWKVKLWDAMSGAEKFTLAGHASLVNAVAFSPDGRIVASASQDGTVRLWDAATGRELRVLSGHTRSVVAVTFSPNGRRLASASFDHTVKVWDALSGQETLSLKGHHDRVMGVAFSRDGHRLASAGWDKTVKVWDARPMESAQ